MTGDDASARPAPGQSDLLLWIAAAAVGAVAVTWLLMLKPWRTDEPAPPPEVAAETRAADAQTADSPAADSQAAAAAGETVPQASAALRTDATGRAAPAHAGAGGARIDSGFEDPLTTAQLALEAGLLVEPEAHSAWSLFSSVLALEPAHEAALAGRARVAELLVARADTALEQGRIDDARAVAERILGAIEGHAGAARLAARIEELTRPPPPPPEPEPREPEPEPEAEAEAVAAEAAPPGPDPIVAQLDAAQASFEEAMRSSRLLTPADASARHFVDVMLDLDAADDRAIAARDRLFRELLSRSRQALEALDTAAARIWIEEADELDADPAAVERARVQLVATLIARESERRLPISSFEMLDYVAPEYPSVARRRELEGWVEVEFTIATNGSTRDIAVLDASHESMFRDETVAAVEQWRFEPRMFMDRPIDQRTHTRIRFDLD